MPHHLRSAVFQAGCAPPGPRGPPCRCCSTRRWTCAASPRRSPTPTACASRRPTPAAPCAYLNGAGPDAAGLWEWGAGAVLSAAEGAWSGWGAA